MVHTSCHRDKTSQHSKQPLWSIACASQQLRYEHICTLLVWVLPYFVSKRLLGKKNLADSIDFPFDNRIRQHGIFLNSPQENHRIRWCILHRVSSRYNDTSQPASSSVVPVGINCKCSHIRWFASLDFKHDAARWEIVETRKRISLATTPA